MARYQRPPDPREAPDAFAEYQQRDRGAEERQPIPWKWLGLGLLVTLVGLGVAAALLGYFLFREPLPAPVPGPEIIRLTAPPGAAATATPLLPTATNMPTLTPPATPDLSIAPEAITVGYYAAVANTDNVGVSLRGGPSTDNIRLQLIPEGTPLLVSGGPEEGNGLIWWQVRLEDGTEGWVAGDFLIPSAAPATE
ncbi:MAG: SH3 domain-containing protein [Chloroflexota bacterium]|jgi:hypothetical protein